MAFLLNKTSLSALRLNSQVYKSHSEKVYFLFFFLVFECGNGAVKIHGFYVEIWAEVRWCVCALKAWISCGAWASWEGCEWFLLIINVLGKFCISFVFFLFFPVDCMYYVYKIGSEFIYGWWVEFYFMVERKFESELGLKSFGFVLYLMFHLWWINWMWLEMKNTKRWVVSWCARLFHNDLSCKF